MFPPLIGLTYTAALPGIFIAPPELFWALRGGGGNLGVVTALRVRLHRLPTFRWELLAFPWEEARDVLRGYADLLADAPDELIAAGAFSAPSGSALVYIAPTWCRDPAAGDAILGRLAALGKPVMQKVAATIYSAALGVGDALFSAADTARSARATSPG